MRFRRRDLERIRALERELNLLALDRPRALTYLLPAVQELLGADNAVAYQLEPGPELKLGLLTGAITDGPARKAWEALIAQQPESWTGYNPRRPEPEQRNRAIDSARMLGWDGLRALPVYQRVMVPFGLGEHDHLRVLICEGQSLLGFVGGLRHGALFSGYERALLQRLVPALHRRLTLERHLVEGPETAWALDAALEALPGEAYLVDGRGRLSHANHAGRTRLERDRAGASESAEAALKGRPSTLSMQRLSGGGALLTGRVDRRSQRVSAAARIFELTARQTEVLAQLAMGKSNAEIAAALGCSPMTVEVHLKAVCEKLQCQGRTAMLARLLEL